MFYHFILLVLMLWGLAPLISSSGFRYYVHFIDEYSHFLLIYFLHTKDELVSIFKLFKAQVENLLNTTINVLQSDGGLEYKLLSRLFL